MKISIKKIALSAKRVACLSIAFSLLLSCGLPVSDEDKKEEKVSSSSGEQKESYKYCVFMTLGICLSGPFSECDVGGSKSNDCPFGSSMPGSSNSALTPSSNSRPSSSSYANSNTDIDLKRFSFELSLAGKSYGDIDAGKTYSQAEAMVNAEDIDIVAYYKVGAGNKIFNPCYVSTIGDNCGAPELYPIPQKYQAAIKSATKTSDIAEFLEDFDKILGAPGEGINGGDKNEVAEIDISKDKSFLVLSTDIQYFIVIITATGTESVSLDFSGNAFNKL